jgi:hypothetical protein
MERCQWWHEAESGPWYPLVENRDEWGSLCTGTAKESLQNAWASPLGFGRTKIVSWFAFGPRISKDCYFADQVSPPG